MTGYIKQHFVPQFLLKKWAGADEKLVRYYWSSRKLEVERKSPTSVAYERKLINFRYRPDVISHSMESAFLGPKIDSPAYCALQHLLKSEQEITNNMRFAWARFVASLIVRNPDVVRNKLRNAEGRFREILHSDQSDYERNRGENDEPTINSFMDKAFPGFAKDIGIELIPQLIDLLGDRIAKEMEWLVIPTEETPFDLLIGDRPVIATQEICNQKCIVALPISPRRIFLAGRPGQEWNVIQAASPLQLARAVNIETLGMARKEVYGSDNRQLRFVENRLRRMSSNDESRE